MLKINVLSQSKKTTIALIAIVFIGSFLYLYLNKLSPESAPVASNQSLSHKEVIKRQIEELNRLSSDDSQSRLTQDQVKNQIEELNKLSKGEKNTPISQETIKKQTEELRRLEDSN